MLAILTVPYLNENNAWFSYETDQVPYLVSMAKSFPLEKHFPSGKLLARVTTPTLAKLVPPLYAC